MYRSALTSIFFSILAVVGLPGLALGANAGDVVINEVYPNAPTYFDGAEYIELYNTTEDSIHLGGWILNGVDFGHSDSCTGYRHEFPAGVGIPAHGYFVIVRDVINNDTTGYEDYFGKLPNLEMYDASQYYEVNDPRVPNTTVRNPVASYDDQLRLIPGPSDYGNWCNGEYDRYEVIYLYDARGMANLIDAMEYRTLACTGDACTGIGASDNDAFPSYPNPDLSLGRDAASTDDGNSSTDFSWQTPTPGQQNIENLPPDVWSLDYSPCAPEATDSVTISCYVTDPDGVGWLECVFKQGTAAWDSVSMYTLDTGDTLVYQVKLAPKALQTQVLFYVKAADGAGIVGRYPEEAKYDPYRYSVGLTAISVIQEVDIGSDRSPKEGLAVNVTGVVTAGIGTFFYPDVFVVQQDSGPWSGIHVYDPTGSVPAAAGDLVTLSGIVREHQVYYTDTLRTTRLTLFSGCYTEHSSGNPIGETIVPTGDLSTLSVFAESYEGVLVTTENVDVTNGDLGYGEWEIDDGSGPCVVDDEAYYAYSPKTGDALQAVRGVGYYSFGGFKIEPRGDHDLIGAISVSNVKYTPHAPTTSDVITVSGEVRHGVDLDWVYLYRSTDGGASFDSSLMSSGDDTLYTGTIGPYPVNHTIVDYYVRAKDILDKTARRPDSGSYDLRIGEHTIYEIQSNFGIGDSSAYAGEPVNVSGIVTAGVDDYGPYNIYIQEPYAYPETPAHKGIRVYTRSDTLDILRGDSVTVSGDVWEYYNETEIAMFFPEAITVHVRGTTVPEAYPVPTASVESEEWEGVLLSARACEVVDPDIGFGDWWITNGALGDTCRVGDEGTYTYEPVLGDSVDVHGIVVYAYRSYNLEPRDDNDIHDPSWVGIEGEPGTPVKLALAVSPNPVSHTGDIKFALPASGDVSLKVYNIHGQLVETLVDGKIDAGEYGIRWSGTNAQGNRVTSGIYFFRLETGRGSVIKKVVVSR